MSAHTVGRIVSYVVLVLIGLVALAPFVFLLISEHTPLFGFMESGYRLAIVLTLVFDTLATVFLGVFVLIVARARRDYGASSVRPARGGSWLHPFRPPR